MIQLITISLAFLYSAIIPSKSELMAQSAQADFTNIINDFHKGEEFWQASLFEKSLQSLDQLTSKDISIEQVCYWKTVNLFHLVLYYEFGLEEHKDKEKSASFLEKALESVQTCLNQPTVKTEIHALAATLKGIKILQKFYLGPILGLQVQEHLKNIKIEESINPREHYLYGLSIFHMPSILGGGSTKALTHLLKAEAIFDKEIVVTDQPHWGYSYNLTFIAQCYLDLNQPKSAQIYLEKALKLNSRNLLATSLQQRMSKDDSK